MQGSLVFLITYAILVPTNVKKGFGMKGFDPRWSDLPHYILGITKEIWEDRGIAASRRCTAIMAAT